MTDKEIVSYLNREADWYRKQIELHNRLPEEDQFTRRASHNHNKHKLRQYESVIDDILFPTTRFELVEENVNVTADRIPN